MQCTFGSLALGGITPVARASMRGSAAYPHIEGRVRFYPWQGGTLVRVEVGGLPQDGFYGFHIHSMGQCQSGGDVDFTSAGGHYDPTGTAPHPNHAGDLPNLLASNGKALMICYTGRFQPWEVVGRSVILHAMPDDGHSQPAGDAGARIACGVIEGTGR